MNNFTLSPGMTQLRQAQRCLQELQLFVDTAPAGSFEEASDELKELLQFNSRYIAKYTMAEAVNAFTELIKTAPAFEVIVAVKPTEDFLQDLTKWLRDNLNDQSLVSYKVRRSISGGAIIRTPNRIYDFSFQSKLRNNTPVIRLSEVLRRV